jgi:hypothetical protein
MRPVGPDRFDLGETFMNPDLRRRSDEVINRLAQLKDSL